MKTTALRRLPEGRYFILRFNGCHFFNDLLVEVHAVGQGALEDVLVQGMDGAVLLLQMLLMFRTRLVSLLRTSLVITF